MFYWSDAVTLLLTQQSLERQRTAEKERLFLVYAKQWWREFLEIRPSHQSKLVKIFAQVCLWHCLFVNLINKAVKWPAEIVHWSDCDCVWGWTDTLVSGLGFFAKNVSATLCRMRMASTDLSAPMCMSSGPADSWRALDRQPASSACWPTRKPQWWEEGQGSRSSGAR